MLSPSVASRLPIVWSVVTVNLGQGLSRRFFQGNDPAHRQEGGHGTVVAGSGAVDQADGGRDPGTGGVARCRSVRDAMFARLKDIVDIEEFGSC